MHYRLALLALPSLIACKTLGHGGTAVQPAVLTVDNRSFADMRIYLLDDAVRTRLGEAHGHSTTNLTIHGAVIGTGRELRFLAEPIGGNRPSVSERIFVEPQDTVVVVIPPG